MRSARGPSHRAVSPLQTGVYCTEPWRRANLALPLHRSAAKESQRVPNPLEYRLYGSQVHPSCTIEGPDAHRGPQRLHKTPQEAHGGSMHIVP